MYREFKLAYYNEIGKRTLQSFNSFKKARKAADNVNVSLMKGEVKSLVLSNDDKVVYLRALKALKPTGTALDLAAHQFAALVKVLGGASPLEAARYYIRRHPTKLPRKTVQEVVEEFIGSRRQAKRSEEYVEDLEYRLGRFAKAFQTCIADVSQSDVVRFLSGLGLSARSQYNFRKVPRTFFEFAKMRGYLCLTAEQGSGWIGLKCSWSGPTNRSGRRSGRFKSPNTNATQRASISFSSPRLRRA